MEYSGLTISVDKELHGEFLIPPSSTAEVPRQNRIKSFKIGDNGHPAGVCLLKVNNKSTATRCEIC